MTALPRDVEALRTLSFFSELTDEDLARVAKVGRRRTFGAGDVLVERGSESGGLFVILSGTVSVDAGGAIHQLGPGDFFGEMALLGGTHSTGTPSDFFGEHAALGRTRRSANVTAVEPVEALVIETVYFEPFLLQNPSVAVAILHGVVGRLREVQARLEERDS
ncbi:MAG TPA: cyclic nucleotide-binding domain-containing protein [Actinomycetota bacterium]|nr:cyclic nucleotide-binding domain-containing protein [Actinomycetota bacterium]